MSCLYDTSIRGWPTTRHPKQPFLSGLISTSSFFETADEQNGASQDRGVDQQEIAWPAGQGDVCDSEAPDRERQGQRVM